MLYLKSFKKIFDEQLMWQLFVNVNDLNNFYITTWNKLQIDIPGSGYRNHIGDYKELGLFNSRQELEKFKIEYQNSSHQ